MFDCNKVIKKCKANCCCYVPLPKEFWEKHKKKAQKKVVLLKWDKELVLPLTEDMSCSFLAKDYKCVIYEVRPWVCRAFGPTNIKGLKCFWLKASGSKRGKRKREKLERQNHENLVRIKNKIEHEISKHIAKGGENYGKI